jgi:6-phosphogluconolactonase/glucosamine-6-phosphate isomerase/deaminase
MKEHIVSSLGEPVGRLWKSLQAKYTESGTFSVASPLSSTPLPIYEWIINNSAEFVGWDKVRFVLMDEMLENNNSPYAYVSTDDPASYEGFAKKHLLEPLKRRTGIAVEVVKPDANKIGEFSNDIDLLILAIGVKGNYANVMPDTPEQTGWHIAHLIPEFRQSHTQQGSQSFEGADFREYGMSLGHQQVLSAKNVVVIISGEKKRELAKQLKSYSTFNPEFPLSIIYHSEVKDRVEIFITEDVT